MDRIESLRLFTVVAELESFTRAAERMGMTPGAASKQISGLEEHLQVRLLERTTRSVRLTDAGRALLDRVQPWLNEYEAIENGLAAEEARAAVEAARAEVAALVGAAIAAHTSDAESDLSEAPGVQSLAAEVEPSPSVLADIIDERRSRVENYVSMIMGS